MKKVEDPKWIKGNLRSECSGDRARSGRLVRRRTAEDEVCRATAQRIILLKRSRNRLSEVRRNTKRFLAQLPQAKTVLNGRRTG